MYKYYATRCYSDNGLCKFLDICVDNGIEVKHVVTISADYYLVLYRWHKHVECDGSNITDKDKKQLCTSDDR